MPRPSARAVVLAVLAVLAVVTGACSSATAGSGSGGGNRPSASEPDVNRTDANDQRLGVGQHLCAYAGPAALEKIFGGPVKGYALDERSCRFEPDHARVSAAVSVQIDGSGLRYPDDAGFDGLWHNLVENQQVSSFRICEQARARWNGLRTVRYVLCPAGPGAEYAGQPVRYTAGAMLEFRDRWILYSQPAVFDDQATATTVSTVLLQVEEALAPGAAHYRPKAAA